MGNKLKLCCLVLALFANAIFAPSIGDDSTLLADLSPRWLRTVNERSLWSRVKRGTVQECESECRKECAKSYVTRIHKEEECWNHCLPYCLNYAKQNGIWW